MSSDGDIWIADGTFLLPDAALGAAQVLLRAYHAGHMAAIPRAERVLERGCYERLLPFAVPDALAWHGFVVTQTPVGIVRLGYTGRGGHEEAILRALAPCVAAGSYLEFHARTGARWRLAFTGETLHRLEPRIVWPEVAANSATGVLA